MPRSKTIKDEQDRFGLCPLHHPAFCGDLSRRGFLELVAVAGTALGVAGQAAANLRQSTLLVVGRNNYHGTVFPGDVYGPVGTKLKFLAGEEYVKCYRDVPVDDAVRQLADETIQRAKELKEVTRDDVLQAARHYFASRRLLAEHGADGLTTVCLHLCGQVGTPCIGFMRLMDEGIVEGAEDDPHKVAGFHVLQVYGDHVRKLRDFGQLYRIKAVHAWDPRVPFDFEPNCA